MSDIEINESDDLDQERQAAESPVAAEPVSVPSPGLILRQLREDLGYSQANVAEALYITEHYVKALENEEFHMLPGKTFIRGYYKAYAKLLGADSAEIIKCYENYAAAMVETQVSEEKVIRARRTYDQNKRWLLCAAGIIVLVVAANWWFNG